MLISTGVVSKDVSKGKEEGRKEREDILGEKEKEGRKDREQRVERREKKKKRRKQKNNREEDEVRKKNNGSEVYRRGKSVEAAEISAREGGSGGFWNIRNLGQPSEQKYSLCDCVYQLQCEIGIIKLESVANLSWVHYHEERAPDLGSQAVVLGLRLQGPRPDVNQHET
jgi:hypothetical protein